MSISFKAPRRVNFVAGVNFMAGRHFREIQTHVRGSAWSRIDRTAGHFVAHLDLRLKLFSASLSPPFRAVAQLNPPTKWPFMLSPDTETTLAPASAARPTRLPAFKVALIDPSLFTLPYDVKLAAGLREIGHSVMFYGKALGPEEAAPAGAKLVQHFYPEMQSWGLQRWPGGVSKAVKGALHLRSMRRLLDVLRAEQPDIIHFQWLPLPIIDRSFIGALRSIAPLVLTAHDSRPFNASPSSMIQKLGATSALGRFDRVVVHTEQARRRLVDYGVEPDRIVRIAHGFLHDDEPAANPVPATADGKSVSFLLFGKIKPYKGVDIAIEAMHRIAPDMRERCVLRIVGKPYIDTKPLLRAAAELGPSLVLDFRHVPDREIPALWEQADVLLFPYREIDMSGVLMSALTAARPIIASRIGGFTELLENGRTALLVPPDDPDALSAAMQRVAGEPTIRQEMSQQIRALAATIPTWRAIARETAAVYAQAREARTARG
jgi:glycosyltransferase involved in cell wall biosynthesis